MKDSKELLKIKDKYGESMMHFCRMMFPTLLENGILFELLKSKFPYSKFLYSDIINNNLSIKFKNYIHGIIDVNENRIVTDKTPEELFKEAGYTLYECKSEKDIQSFKKYYEINEEICTFIYQDRLNSYFVFFAVKDNVNEIKRKNFPNPDRQDEYGTSVISIQFMKGNINHLSIKNRYNHTVLNPDATFSNNLDNIMPGLTYAFEKKYNLIVTGGTTNFEIPLYTVADDGKYYKYNYEINNIYYCPNNIIIDKFEIIKYDLERYIVLDYFVLDLKEKKISLYDEFIKDSFINDFLDNIKKINVVKTSEYKKIVITPSTGSEIIIILDKLNRIIKYSNENITKIGNWYLYHSSELNYINIKNVEEIGNNCFVYNEKLTNLEIPKTIKIGKWLLGKNRNLKSIYAPNLEETDIFFLNENVMLEEINFPKLKVFKNGFLEKNYKLKKVYCPSLENYGQDCLIENDYISLQNVICNNKQKVLKK